MNKRIALVRPPDKNISNCELTHINRSNIDFQSLLSEHDMYCEALMTLGLNVIQMPQILEAPDAVFVEDTAIILKELAIITRPGAPSRRLEAGSTLRALTVYKYPIHTIMEPGIMDGGDVLVVEKTLFVGLSSRTNIDAAKQLEKIVTPYNYEVRTLNVSGCLHLKTAATYLKNKTLLVNPAWVSKSSFGDFDFIETTPDEPFGANSLSIGETTIYSSAYPKTLQIMRNHGIKVLPLEFSEFSKAEAGLTCLSLIFET